MKGRAHPGFTHGYRSRVLREVAAIMQKGAVMSLWEALVVTEEVRAKRAELVALVYTIEAIKMQDMTTAELRAYLRLPLSPGDVVLR